MAGDVARLGLAVDSSQVLDGSKALDGLTNAASKAEKSSGDLTNAFARLEKLLSQIERAVRDVERAVLGLGKGAGAVETKIGSLGNAASSSAFSMGQLSISGAKVTVTFGKFQAAAGSAATAASDLTTNLNAQAAAANKAANANMKAAAAANDNGFKAGAHNVSNLAAQVQDVLVTAGGGMAAIQIGLQQGLQLAAVLGTMDKPILGVAAAIASVFSPLSLLVIGLTTLAAASIQMVNWSKVGASALRGLASALQVVAPYAAAVAAALALIYAPAIVSGIASITVALGRLAVAAVSATAAMAAANPVGAIALGIAAAIAAAIAFRDELAKILSVDIVGAAKTGVNYIIGSFVAAFNDIKFVWSNLGDIIGASVIGATNSVVYGLNAMVQKAVGMIDGLIGMVNKIPGVSIPLIGEVAPMTPAANPYADRLAKASANRGAQQQKELNADYLGQFGGAISSGASTAAGKLRDLANQLLTDPGKKSKGGKTDAEKYDDIISAADRRIAQLKAEADGLGLTEEASARLRYETELLNQADQKGIDLSAAQRAELGAKAAAMAQVEIAAKNVKSAFDFAKDATSGFLSDLRTGLANGENIFKSFGNAALNVLNKIVDKFQSMAVDSLFSSGGGSSGLFGSILNGLGSLFTGGTPLGMGGIGAAATGGLVRGPGSGTSDTAGLFALSNGEYVVNAAATARNRAALEAMNSGRIGRMASGGYVGTPVNSNQPASGGSAPITIAPVYNVNSAGMQMSQEQLQAVLEQHQRDTVKKSVAAVEASRARVIRSNRT